VAGGVGIGLAKSDYWSKELALRPFQAQRPMTCAGLVIAKFKAAAVISLLGWVAAAPLIWGITLLPRWRELWHSAELTARTLHSLPADRSLAIWTCAGALFLAVLLTWKTMVESLALGLTGRLAGVLSRSVARGIFVVILLSITAWLGRHPSQLALFAPWAYAAAGLLTLWKVFGTARAFSLLRQQRLLAPGGIAALSFLWVGFAVSLGAALFLAQLRAGGLHPVVALAVAGFWPDGSFGRAILNLQSSRHR